MSCSGSIWTTFRTGMAWGLPALLEHAAACASWAAPHLSKSHEWRGKSLGSPSDSRMAWGSPLAKPMAKPAARYATLGGSTLPLFQYSGGKPFVSLRFGQKRGFTQRFLLLVCSAVSLLVLVNVALWRLLTYHDEEDADLSEAHRSSHLVSGDASRHSFLAMSDDEALEAMYPSDAARVPRSHSGDPTECEARFTLLLVADMDHATPHLNGSWHSSLRRGSLCWRVAAPAAAPSAPSFSVSWVDEVPLTSGINRDGRGTAAGVTWPLPGLRTAPPTGSQMGHLKAWDSPTHSRAPPRQLGGSPWPAQPAAGRPKDECFSPWSTSRHGVVRAGLVRGAAAHLRRPHGRRVRGARRRGGARVHPRRRRRPPGAHLQVRVGGCAARSLTPRSPTTSKGALQRRRASASGSHA